MEKETNDPIEALHDIRHMMKRSSRFLSLSGLSGVFAGMYALGGAVAAKIYLKELFGQYFHSRSQYNRTAEYSIDKGDLMHPYLYFSIVAAIVLFLSLSTGFYFSQRKAKKLGKSLFDHSARQLFVNLAIPLGAGGLFCLIMLVQGYILLIPSAMLLFYGMALLNASKYTLDEVRYLGITEIILGLLCAMFPAKGLLFWALGFGAMHILYGTIMWWRHERTIKN